MNIVTEKITMAASHLPIQGQIPGLNDDDISPHIPVGFETVGIVIGWVRWGALVVCIVALIAFFGHLAMERQNGNTGQGSMGWLGKILVAIIGITGSIAVMGVFWNA
jgi:hypothetical protein